MRGSENLRTITRYNQRKTQVLSTVADILAPGLLDPQRGFELNKFGRRTDVLVTAEHAAPIECKHADQHHERPANPPTTSNMTGN